MSRAAAIAPAERYDVGCVFCSNPTAVAAGRMRRKSACDSCISAFKEAGKLPPAIQRQSLPPSRIRALARYLMRRDGHRDYYRPLFERALRARGSYRE